MITDNNFSMEEFSAAITANPALLDVAKGYFTEQKYSVMNENEMNTHNESTRSDVVSGIATKVESNIKTLTGIDKTAPDEKWHAYYMRAAKTLKTQLDDATTKLASYEGKSDITEAEREQLKTYATTVSNLNKSIEDTKLEYEGKIAQTKLENKINAAAYACQTKFISDPKFKKAIDIMHENTIAQMSKEAQIKDGKIVYFDENKKAMKNADNSFVTTEQRYLGLMDDFVDKGKKQGGAGGDGGPSGSSTPAGEIKCQYDLQKHLNDQGLVSGTSEFNKKFAEMGGDKLPMMV